MSRLIIIGRTLAILTILIGIVHEVLTFHPMIAEGFTGLEPEWQQTFTYFSLGCGGLLRIPRGATRRYRAVRPGRRNPRHHLHAHQSLRLGGVGSRYRAVSNRSCHPL